MKKEYKYVTEIQDMPNDWLVFKKDDTWEEADVVYKVELNAHGKDAHQCTCEYGIRLKEGQTEKRCKHVLMAMEAYRQRMAPND